MANFSEEFYTLLQDQNTPPLKEVSDSSQQKSVSKIWSHFGESLESAGLETDLPAENKENMSEAANVHLISSDERTDSHENGHGEESDGKKITSVSDTDDEEIGSSQEVFDNNKAESQSSFQLRLEDTQYEVAVEEEIVPSSQGSLPQTVRGVYSSSTSLGFLSGSKVLESPEDIFQESLGLQGSGNMQDVTEVLTSQSTQPDPYGECSEKPFLNNTPTGSLEGEAAVREVEGGLKWSDKFKAANVGKLNFNSSTSSEMDNLGHQKSFDDSVEVIEDSPKGNHNSTIDLVDSFNESKEEFKLVLDDTQSPVTKRSTSDSHQINISPMSEILASNRLLYQNVDDIDQVIGNDEDVQSMLAHPSSDLMDLDDSKEDGDMSDFMLQKSPSGVHELNLFSPKKSKKETWSPKKEIWSSKNEKKRKAKEASLSSGDESSKKKIDSKDINSEQDLPSSSSNLIKMNEKSSEAHHADDETTQPQHKQDTDSGPESRPGSSQAIQSPDISCSPIIALISNANHGREGSQDPSVRRTSTPGQKCKSIAPGLSSPQKHLRKKLRQEMSPNQNSSEDEAPMKKQETNKQKSRIIPEDETQIFKEPTPLSSPEGRVISFLLPDSKTLKNSKYQKALEALTELGIVQIDPPVTNKKRLSDVSALSSGGSSGYLGGSSSGVTSSSGGSGRSRLSIAPETNIEKHQVISKLPNRSLLTEASSVEAVAGSQESVKEVPQGPSVEFADDLKVETIASQRKMSDIQELPEEVEPKKVVTGAKKGRKRKVSSDVKEKEPTPRKRLTKKRNVRKESEDSDDEPEESQEVEVQPKINYSDDRYGIGNKVFARWVDGTGVYFYAAVIKSMVNEEEVKVMFMEDKIERVVKKENEVIAISQLKPGHNVTVKHDIYNAYEVTASLMKYPVKRGNDYEYEVSIAATDSEPQNNEDSRTVGHKEISLTDSQACAVLRNLGLIPSSNKVSAEINFENLIFSKRKARANSTNTTPIKAETIKTPRRKRGGENIEDSAPTTYESSAAELSPKKRIIKPVDTPKKGPKTPKLNTPKAASVTPRRQKSRIESTDDDEEVMPSASRRMQTAAKEKSKSSTEPVPKLSRRSSKSKEIFAGFSFIITQSKEHLPMTEPDDESYSESEPQNRAKSLVPKFNKKSLHNVITAHGGKILTEYPTHLEPVSTLDTTLITVSDHRCVTMNYLLSLAHSVPIVSHVYILDCVSSGSLLDRGAYLLPAGFSKLLMREVEQGQDCNQELRINDCLLPSPPATSTRLSSRVKEEDMNVSCRKILSGLHVLIISTDKLFTDDWQSVLDSLGAAVTKRTAASARLAQLRAPDVVVTDSKAPSMLCSDLSVRNDIPVVSTDWVIQCAVNNGRIAFNNFKCKLPN